LAVLVCNGCFHQVLVHCSPSKGSRKFRHRPADSARRGCTASASSLSGWLTVVVAPVIRVRLLRRYSSSFSSSVP
jgi:hypothetical protein